MHSILILKKWIWANWTSTYRRLTDFMTKMKIESIGIEGTQIIPRKSTLDQQGDSNVSFIPMGSTAILSYTWKWLQIVQSHLSDRKRLIFFLFLVTYIGPVSINEWLVFCSTFNVDLFKTNQPTTKKHNAD